MKITEIIFEDQETDEGVGSAIGRGLGAVGKGIGAVAAVPQGIGRAIKKGYQSGVATIAGDNAPVTTQATAAQPAATPQATATTMKQITAAVPALRTRDLQSLKKTVDAALAAKAKAPTPPATGSTTPTMTSVAGGRAPAVK
jgi:hypothetical protein